MVLKDGPGETSLAVEAMQEDELVEKHVNMGEKCQAVAT